MLRVVDVSKSYNGKDVLNNISFSLDEGEKAGIIGLNGIGKTTLLKIIAGDEKPDSGKIIRDKNSLVGYFKQEFKISEEDRDIISFIKNFIGIDVIEKQMNEAEKTMGTDESKIQEFCDLQEEYLRLDGYNIDYKLDQILSGLGLDNTIKKKKISELSGGQKEKVMLTAVLLKGTDLLLLDEPTNNLDIKSMNWLEKYLKNNNSPMLIVSHDRKFLDDVITKVMEIDFYTRNMKEYPGNYSEYKKFKEDEQNAEIRKYNEQQEKIGELRKSITQKKEWAQKGNKQGVSDNDKYTRGYIRDRSQGLASNAKKIEVQINQMDKIERPKIKNRLHIDIKGENTKGNKNIETRNLVSGYENGFKNEPVTTSIEYGDRLVIMGNNGSGKSTFLRTLIGKQKPISGEQNIGSGVKIGYLAQDTKENTNETIEDYFKKSINYASLEDKSLIYTVLKQFNFDYEERAKKYSMLSPGERTRLKLAIFSMQDINTLVLDEPTNHLDIEALEAIEEVLKDFDGTVIAISHDREFIKNISPTKILKFANGKVEEIYHKNEDEKADNIDFEKFRNDEND